MFFPLFGFFYWLTDVKGKTNWFDIINRRHGNADLLYYPLHLVCCPATAASALSRGIEKRCTGTAQVPRVLACHCGADRLLVKGKIKLKYNVESSDTQR